MISYDPNSVEECRLAAGYIDRILRGEKSADLPVQAATKYELVINVKIARALASPFRRPFSRADEVIE